MSTATRSEMSQMLKSLKPPCPYPQLFYFFLHSLPYDNNEGDVKIYVEKKLVLVHLLIFLQ